MQKRQDKNNGQYVGKPFLPTANANQLAHKIEHVSYGWLLFFSIKNDVLKPRQMWVLTTGW